MDSSGCVADQSHFDVTVDSTRNLVRTRYVGVMTPVAMQAAARRVEALLPGLRPGFTALTDFSQIEAIELDCVPHLTRIMDLCRDHGIGTLIRVLPKPEKDIGINILSVVHYGQNVVKMTVDTTDEAERALN